MIWRFGDLEIWKFGNKFQFGDLEIWKFGNKFQFGDLEIWRFGDGALLKNKCLRMYYLLPL